jgi:hypothetical protein
MQLGISRYDPGLQMFVDRPHEPDVARLRFWRWLGEQGQLEHAVAGAPAGEYAVHLFPIVEVVLAATESAVRQEAGHIFGAEATPRPFL